MSLQEAKVLFDTPEFVARGEELINLLSNAVLSRELTFAWDKLDTKEYEEVRTFLNDHQKSKVAVEAVSEAPYVIDEWLLCMFSAPFGVTSTTGRLGRYHRQVIIPDADSGLPSFFLKSSSLPLGPLNVTSSICAVSQTGQRQARIAIGD